MPKVSQQYRDARRDQILNAARRCFLRDGFHGTSMQDLFAEAGLSSGAVYRYFASKDDMIVAIAEENMRGVVEMIHAAAGQPGRSAGAVLADVLETVRARDAENGLGQIALLVWAESLRSPAIADRLRVMVTQIRVGLAEVASAHQRSAGLPGDISDDEFAALLFSIIPGYILQLALLGPAAAEGIPDTLRALCPSPPAGSPAPSPAR
jgi:TetR/AcrR family transcriptional regulator, transcriptional repressor of aconitase